MSETPQEVSKPTARDLIDYFISRLDATPGTYTQRAQPAVVVVRAAFEDLLIRVERVLAQHQKLIHPLNGVDICAECAEDWPCQTSYILNGGELCGGVEIPSRPSVRRG